MKAPKTTINQYIQTLSIALCTIVYTSCTYHNHNTDPQRITQLEQRVQELEAQQKTSQSKDKASSKQPTTTEQDDESPQAHLIRQHQARKGALQLKERFEQLPLNPNLTKQAHKCSHDYNENKHKRRHGHMDPKILDWQCRGNQCRFTLERPGTMILTSIRNSNICNELLGGTMHAMPSPTNPAQGIIHAWVELVPSDSP